MSERAFEIEQATTGMDIMPTQLYVCNACCCGVERKGNMAVPLEELKQAWAEHSLAPEVKLTVSSCLGPCSMANVCMFTNESGENMDRKLEQRRPLSMSSLNGRNRWR